MSTQLVEPTTTGQRDNRMPLVVPLLVVVIVVQLVGMLWLNGRVDDLQRQVAGATAAAMAAQSPVTITDPSAADSCRLLGVLAVKAGYDLPTIFRDQGVTGACESAAETAAHNVRSAG